MPSHVRRRAPAPGLTGRPTSVGLAANEAVETGSRVYNAIGQLESRGAGASQRTFAYDVFGMLRTTSQGAITTTYDWDGLGRLVAIRPETPSPTSPKQRFVYRDALEPVAWTRFDGTTTDTAWFVYATQPHVPDLMVLDRGSDGSLDATYRYLTDERGSVRRVIDVASGDAAQVIEYDAWGVAAFGAGGEGFQPFGFTGAIWMGAPRLWHMGARDYDPEVGRWTAMDPIGFRGGVNLYAYSDSDPVNHIDPTGRWVWLAVAIPTRATAAGAAAGDLVGQAITSGRETNSYSLDPGHAIEMGAIAGGVGIVALLMLGAPVGAAMIGATALVFFGVAFWTQLLQYLVPPADNSCEAPTSSGVFRGGAPGSPDGSFPPPSVGGAGGYPDSPLEYPMSQ